MRVLAATRNATGAVWRWGVTGLFPSILLTAHAMAASPAALQDPPVFASQNGLLSVLMVAAQRTAVPIATPLGTVTTDLWTYEVCNLPYAGANACPAGSGKSGLGGVRLQLQPGDKMKIRLVNQLPIVPDADHIADNPYLINNPTNLHTHGLIVDPHRAVGPSDTYGDYVFVQINNPANQAVPPGVASVTPVHPGLDVATGAAEYAYNIDATHPPGLFWFHPHVHGLSLNQVNAGLAGAITIGSVAEECGDAACLSAVQQSTVRTIVLKDTQVSSGGVLKSQPDPGFCDGAPASPRQGSCPGQGDFAGGTWLNTVNGQVYPQIHVGPSGDIWRILNASGSRSYQLSVNDSMSGRALPLQLIAIDGITLGMKPGADVGVMASLMKGKVTLIPCPGRAGVTSQSVCADTVRMMPSSRVELRVVRMDQDKPDQQAIFKTAQYDTGEADLGDHWPAIDLASVVLTARDQSVADQLSLNGAAQTAMSKTGHLLTPATMQVPGSSNMVSALLSGAVAAIPASGPTVQFGLKQASNTAITPQLVIGQTMDSKCRPLAAGHHRKITFGYPTPETFGLGYVEVDQNGHDIEATRQPVHAFDPTQEMVCVSLARGAGAEEVWELVNITTEDHNFHIHQTRFHLLAGGTAPGTWVPLSIDQALVLHDNIPVPRPTPAANAANCDGTFGPVNAGICKPTHTFVSIPFRELGDFVFHCHILEHEDGGMMARIRVVVSPAG
jgi:L-ascorbate oxidase